MQFVLRSTVVLIALLAGCASDGKSTWFENGMAHFEVLQVGADQYKLTTRGAGAHTQEQVLSAFATRAAQQCPGGRSRFPAPAVEPYEYNSSGGGFFFVHRAFRATAVVTCN